MSDDNTEIVISIKGPKPKPKQLPPPGRIAQLAAALRSFITEHAKLYAGSEIGVISYDYGDAHYDVTRWNGATMTRVFCITPNPVCTVGDTVQVRFYDNDVQKPYIKSGGLIGVGPTAVSVLRSFPIVPPTTWVQWGGVPALSYQSGQTSVTVPLVNNGSGGGVGGLGQYLNAVGPPWALTIPSYLQIITDSAYSLPAAGINTQVSSPVVWLDPTNPYIVTATSTPYVTGNERIAYVVADLDDDWNLDLYLRIFDTSIPLSPVLVLNQLLVSYDAPSLPYSVPNIYFIDGGGKIYSGDGVILGGSTNIVGGGIGRDFIPLKLHYDSCLNNLIILGLTGYKYGAAQDVWIYNVVTGKLNQSKITGKRLFQTTVTPCALIPCYWGRLNASVGLASMDYQDITEFGHTVTAFYRADDAQPYQSLWTFDPYSVISGGTVTPCHPFHANDNSTRPDHRFPYGLTNNVLFLFVSGSNVLNEQYTDYIQASDLYAVFVVLNADTGAVLLNVTRHWDSYTNNFYNDEATYTSGSSSYGGGTAPDTYYYTYMGYQDDFAGYHCSPSPPLGFPIWLQNTNTGAEGIDAILLFNAKSNTYPVTSYVPTGGAPYPGPYPTPSPVITPTTLVYGSAGGLSGANSTFPTGAMDSLDNVFVCYCVPFLTQTGLSEGTVSNYVSTTVSPPAGVYPAQYQDNYDFYDLRRTQISYRTYLLKLMAPNTFENPTANWVEGPELEVGKSFAVTTALGYPVTLTNPQPVLEEQYALIPIRFYSSALIYRLVDVRDSLLFESRPVLEIYADSVGTPDTLVLISTVDLVPLDTLDYTTIDPVAYPNNTLTDNYHYRYNPRAARPQMRGGTDITVAVSNVNCGSFVEILVYYQDRRDSTAGIQQRLVLVENTATNTFVITTTDIGNYPNLDWPPSFDNFAMASDSSRVYWMGGTAVNMSQ